MEIVDTLFPIFFLNFISYYYYFLQYCIGFAIPYINMNLPQVYTPESLQMVTASMKLKDVFSLEEKLQQT